MEHTSRYRALPEGLKCGERIEQDKDGVRSVIFYCNLPGMINHATLEFSCREPSCGALEGDEEAAILTDDDYVVDPNFFDDGYTMAGKTGFKVWTGTRFLIESLVWKNPSDDNRLKEIQDTISHGARIIELGSGVGVIGTYLAAMGANVMLTDLPTLVENAIDGNIMRNKGILSNDIQCPRWLKPNGVPIGKGWASSTPLDWTIPVEDQLTKEQLASIDFIVASDVVFLVEMLNSLLNTVSDLFKASEGNCPTFILSFQRRDAIDGKKRSAFTTVDSILEYVKQRGWAIECLTWRYVTIRRDTDEGLIQGKTEVYVFEIKP
jgi:predicted nicotinamide N-methyase